MSEPQSGGESRKPYPIVPLGSYCEVLGGKRLPKGFELTEEDTGHPYIRVTDFSVYSVEQEKLKYVPSNVQRQIARYIINSEDVYISIAGTIGLVGQIPDELSGSNLESLASLLRD